MVKFWIGVVSENHVKRGVEGEFCQVCHGKGGPLKRMQKGDYLLYYSPKVALGSNQKLQAFTAVGKMRDDRIYQFEMTPDFVPFRRDVEFYQPVRSCPIGVARQHLEWKTYASQLRYGHFEISKDFFLYIFEYMKLR